jgi:hypothetical protein
MRIRGRLQDTAQYPSGADQGIVDMLGRVRQTAHKLHYLLFPIDDMLGGLAHHHGAVSIYI